MTALRLPAMIALGLFATFSPCQTTTKVHSLDQVPAAIKSKDGLAKFREEMSGNPAPDGFGTTLPSGLSAKTVVALVAPGKDPSLATLVGMKPWPYRADNWIAIVCVASDRAQLQHDLSYNSGKPICQAHDGDGPEGDYTPAEVYLAFLGYRAPEPSPHLLASYGKPLDVTVGWQSSAVEEPTWGESGKPLAPYSYSRFDFAPYRISATDTAFGLRVGWFESFAGGGADFEGIELFVQEGDRLRNILAEPIYSMENLAGDWNPDGTRNHSVEEIQATIVMLPHQTNGHFDLRINTAHGKGRQDFAWSSKEDRYVAMK